jgi:LmbE family N-acetylglucosaminyl deacetylase
MPIDDKDIERVLIVTAHPDDLDFGAAGTIAQWTSKGIKVSYCVCTNGDQGGKDPEVHREDMPVIRQREQRDAGKAVGVSDVHFLNYVDGTLAPTLELRKDIVRVIRKVRPQRLLLQYPGRNWERIFSSHPDHMAAGEAAMQAVYPDAGNPFAFQNVYKIEGLEPWTVSEVWVMGSTTPNHFIDITSTFDKKMQALKAHVSQTAHAENFDQRIRSWAESSAEKAGLPAGSLAEAFMVVSTI